MFTRPFGRCLLPAILIWAALLCLTLPAPGQAAPLLQEGKKSLYQRVISHPGAVLRQSADAASAVVKDKVVPFTVFYVYERANGWLRVGTGLNEPQGWLEEAKSTAWNQSLTLLFAPRAGRDPVLFFKTENDLKALCSANDMEKQLAALLTQAASGKMTADAPVLAGEPAESQGAVDAKRFYLMPILGMSEPFDDVKFLNVASIDPGSGTAQAPDGPPKTGIALVIDTSISMKPYIDQSRDVVRRIYDQLEKEKMTDNVGFAVVAFRSSTTATPGLEYTSAVVSDFATAKDRAALESRLADTEKGISNMLDAIQAGIITASTKQRLAELEAEKEELEQQIIENRIQHPALSREQISFFLSQFKNADVTDKDQRQRLIDSFVNAVYVYEDKIVFTFNYKGGSATVTLGDIQGSDLDAECPP